MKRIFAVLAVLAGLLWSLDLRVGVGDIRSGDVTQGQFEPAEEVSPGRH